MEASKTLKYQKVRMNKSKINRYSLDLTANIKKNRSSRIYLERGKEMDKINDDAIFRTCYLESGQLISLNTSDKTSSKEYNKQTSVQVTIDMLTADKELLSDDLNKYQIIAADLKKEVEILQEKYECSSKKVEELGNQNEELRRERDEKIIDIGRLLVICKEEGLQIEKDKNGEFYKIANLNNIRRESTIKYSRELKEMPIIPQILTEIDQKLINDAFTSSNQQSFKVFHPTELSNNIFGNIDLKPKLFEGILEYGFKSPSPIQHRSLPAIILGNDAIVQGELGSGKSSALAIASLQIIDVHIDQYQIIILSPSKKQAQNLALILEEIGKHSGIQIQTEIDGSPHHNRSTSTLTTSPIQPGHILIGTSNKIYELINKELIKLEGISSFILDEADKILSKGQGDQIRAIIHNCPVMQICLFITDLTKEVTKFGLECMKGTEEILTKREEMISLLDRNLFQYYIAIKDEKWKLNVLLELYKYLDHEQTIIYCVSKKKVDWLVGELQAQGIQTSSIHGEMDQLTKSKIIRDFRIGDNKLIVCTDLFAKGFDAQQADLVINYELPINKEYYLQRIGRSGHFDQERRAINFVTPKDAERLKEIQQYFHIQIDQLPVDLTQVNIGSIILLSSKINSAKKS